MYDITASVRAANATSSQLYFFVNVSSEIIPVVGLWERSHYLIERKGDLVRVHLFDHKVPGSKIAQKTGKKTSPGASMCVPISHLLDFPNEVVAAQSLPMFTTSTGFEFRITYELMQDLQQPKLARPLDNRDIMSEERALAAPLPLTGDEIFEMMHSVIRSRRDGPARKTKTKKVA